MSDNSGKSKSSKPSKSSGSSASKETPNKSVLDSKKSKTKQTSKEIPKQQKTVDLSASSDGDDEFAVHVTSIPVNTAILEVAANIEQST